MMSLVHGTGMYKPDGSLVNGACYLVVFAEARREEVFSKLGLWPSWKRVFSQPFAYVTTGIEQLSVVEAFGVWHVTSGGGSAGLVSRFGPSVATCEFEKGTLGYVVKGDYLPTGNVKDLDAVVGGTVVFRVTDVFPDWVEGGRTYGSEYYAAVRAFLQAGYVGSRVTVVGSGLAADLLSCSQGCLPALSESGERLASESESCEKLQVGSSEAVRGKNWERNQQWKAEKKSKKLRRRERVSVGGLGMKRSEDRDDTASNGSVGGSCGSVPGFGRGNVLQSVELRKTVEAKWIAKNELERKRNELEVENVNRKLALMRAVDLESVIKRERTKVLAATERNMASIEKTHAALAAAGNVPEVFHGSAETVIEGGTEGVPSLVSGSGSLSISPNSSASQAEFRAAQKTILDQEHKIELMQKAFKKIGYTFEDADAVDKCTFTDDTNGNELMDRLYPDGVGIHMVLRDGKTKFKVGGQDF